MDVSFGTIWEAIARDLPDAVAISEPARDYTFAEWDDRAARLAAALSAAGVGPGDKVACYLYNGAAYLETVFAAFKLGAVPVKGFRDCQGVALCFESCDEDGLWTGTKAGIFGHRFRRGQLQNS